MAVELAHQDRFQRTPQGAGTQKRLIVRRQHNFGRVATGADLVRAAKREDATLDPQMLPNDLELQEMRWFNLGDALYQISSSVSATDRRPNAGLVAFSSDGVGQQGAKKERRAPRNFLIKHDVIPDRLRAGVEVNPSLRPIRLPLCARIANSRAGTILLHAYSVAVSSAPVLLTAFRSSGHWSFILPK